MQKFNTTIRKIVKKKALNEKVLSKAFNLNVIGQIVISITVFRKKVKIISVLD